MMHKLIPLVALLGCVAALAAQQPDHSRAEGSARAAAQESSQKQKQKQNQQKPQQKQAEQTKAARRAEHRARRPLLETFPRTRGLLSFLRRQDAATYQAIIEHSSSLARRREAQALRVARRQVPELFRLIQRLKRRAPRAYTSAIRELVADAARLERAREQSKAAYAAALKDWVLGARLRLLGARLRLGVPEARKAEILTQAKALLVQRDAARRDLLRQQKKRHLEQIRRLDARLQKNADTEIQRQLRAIERSARKARPQPKRGK